MAKILGNFIVRKRGVITLPKEARNYLGIKEGEIITILEENNKVFIKKLKTTIEDFNIKK